MSVTRFPMYVWADTKSMHLWARAGLQDDEGVYDPVHRGKKGDSEWYPGFVSGVAMPIEVWDEIVQRYLEKRHIYVDADGKAIE